jgi:hypothetical protein
MKELAGKIECHAVDGQHCIELIRQFRLRGDEMLANEFEAECSFYFFFINPGEKLGKQIILISVESFRAKIE